MNQQPGISFAPGAAGGSPTPAPLHDIVGPFDFFSGSLWVIAAVFLVTALIGGLLWWFFGRTRKKTLTPREAALEAMARLRGTMSAGSDHDFGVGVSDVLRRFLEEALGLAAPRQTTEEFLASLSHSPRFVEKEQESLSEFLHRSDYLKYARGEATLDQRLALIDAAEAFILGGEEMKTQDDGEKPGSPGQGEVE